MGNDIRLLILDFGGVCTPSTSELVATEAGAQIPVRDGIPRIVSDAQTAGRTVVILSNEISTDWDLTTDLFAQVDHVISCADNKIWKPDRRAFQRCLLTTGHAAEHTLVVDDERDNITVAKSLGMETVQFDVLAPEDSIEEITAALR